MESRSIFSEVINTAGFGFSVFGDDEFERIHLATLEIMRTTGLYVGDDDALEILAAGGAFVDRKTRIVKFPAHLVEDCIRSAPPNIVQYGRDPKHDVFLGGKRVNFCTFGQGVNVMETDGNVRPSMCEDVGKAALLTDAMEEVDVCERSLTAGDAPDKVAPVWEAETVFANTAKHTVYGPGNGWRAGKIIKMAQAIAGGEEALREKPILTINCSPTSPLTLDVLAGPNRVEVSSGAMGPHALDAAWGITDTWVGMGFGMERLLTVSKGDDSIGKWSKSLSSIDGIRLNI